MTNPIYRSRVWRVVTKKVLARDGHECQIRMRGCRVVANSVDHIVELEDGGEPYAEENLQAACRPCNTAKRNRSMARRAKLNARGVRRW